MNFQQRLFNPTYLDPQQFLFDKNGALLINKQNIEAPVSTKAEDKKSLKSSAGVIINMNRLTTDLPTRKASKKQEVEVQIHDIRDTSELIEEVLTKIIDPVSEPSVNSTVQEISVKKVVNTITVEEFTDIAKRVFSLFRNSIVSIFCYEFDF